MELLEDEYEDQLIDAFDGSSSNASSSATASNSSQDHARSSTVQPTRSSAQESQTTVKPVGTLYPSFDEVSGSAQAPLVASAVAATTAKQPQTHDLGGARTDSLPQEQELLTSDELQRRRRQIEREMRGYQERFGYVAQALAGETPHQIEGRKKREEERQDRQEKRHATMETRLQHQIDRLHDREERRMRSCERHHRSYQSLSPCEFCEGGHDSELPEDDGTRQRDSD